MLLTPLTRSYWDREYALDRFMTAHGLSSVSISYGSVDEAPRRLTRGEPAPEEQPYYSLSKPLTALAILEAEKQGRLSLDDEVQGATIRQLLKHTGGWDSAVDSDPVIANESNVPCTELPVPERQFAPGERYAYSNIGYCIVGQHLGDVHGTSYEEAARDLLSLSDEIEYRGDLGPAGGWFGSAEPLWNALKRPVSRETFLDPEPRAGDIPYGLGWGVAEDGTLAHFGWLTTADHFTAAIRKGDYLAVALFVGVPSDPDQAKAELRPLLLRFAEDGRHRTGR